MKIHIDFSEPIICKEKILDIRPADLDDFYLAASDFDKNNLFFVLLNSILHYEDSGDIVEAAHLSFLAAYYLFSTLTPPGSQSLALHYINRAVSLNHLAEYDEWLDLIKKGNHTQPTNQQWKDIVEQNLQVAKSFEIHCWSEETEWIDAALQYGEEKETEWKYGKVITGKVTPGFKS